MKMINVRWIVKKYSGDIIFECDIGRSCLLCQLIYIFLIYVCVCVCVSIYRERGEYVNQLTQEATLSYVTLKNHISRIFFHDPTAHYHLHVLILTDIKNQMIWSLFTHWSNRSSTVKKPLMFEPNENEVNKLQIGWFFICVYLRIWRW